MSKKILRIGLLIAAIGVQFIPGIGQAVGLALGISATAATAALEIGLVVAGSLLLGPSKPKGLTDPVGTDRLTATLIPTAPRKIWFGHTAGETDVRYQAFTGGSQEYLEMIVCHASHAVQSIDELWLDNELAWTSAGGVQGRYIGYLTVATRTEGTRTNGIAIDGNWTVNSTLTGCAYSHYKFKLTGNSSNVQSPFASGVTSRMTVRGKGAKVYDPRLDSTVEGGAGAHRADDQTTWTWDDNGSRNPALQELFYELGWRINGKLAVGKGVPPNRIDFASAAVAANLCDESVALNGGGTEPRYRSDGIVSEADDPPAVRDNLCTTMNAVLRDAGGKFAIAVLHNDLATPETPFGKTAFDENDVVGEMQWDQTPPLSSTFNIVRGRRIDPSDQALYQPVDAVEVALASSDGIDRIETVDHPFVQSNGQDQRLRKQRLQRNQYQGKLTFTGKPSFWGLSLGQVFPLTHATFGWSGKLFRLAGQTISRTGETQIVAVEENPAIYQWDNNEAPAVTPGTPTIYDPLNDPLVSGIADAGNSAAPGDGNRVRFSRFERETLGWTLFSATPAIVTDFGVSHLLDDHIFAIGAFTAANQQVTILNDIVVAGSLAFRIPVNPGERIFVSCGIELVEAWLWSLSIHFRAEDDTEPQPPVIVDSGAGPVAFGTRIGGFVDVPNDNAIAFLSFEPFIGNAALGTGAFTFSVQKPMVSGAGSAQTVWPAFTPGPSSEPGAEVQRWIDDPTQRLSFRYDYAGAAESGEFPRDITFKLMSSAGQTTTGIAWTYLVLSGTVNGFTSASGAQPMAGAGTGTLSEASLGSSEAKVQVTATYLGKSYIKTITLSQDVAAPPVSGGGGSTATMIGRKSSGYTNFNSTTFVDISGAILCDAIPAGRTTADVHVNLDCMPAPLSTGSWTVEHKVMRDVAGTPTQVGTTQSKDSDWNSGDVSGDPASFNFTINDSGLTAGVQYTYRIYARTTVSTRLHSTTGDVTVTS